MRQPKIAGSGVATLDIYPIQQRMYPGGNEYNVVCNAAMLGAKAAFIGVYGNDQAGKILEDTLKDVGVDTTHSHYEIGDSGYSIVELKNQWDRKFLYWNRQGVTDLYPVEFNEEELAYLREYDILTLGLLADVSFEKIVYLHENGIQLSYDFNDRTPLEDVKKLAPYIDYGFFSTSHLTLEQVKEYLQTAIEHGMKIAVATNGSEPVYAYNGKEFFKQNTFKVDPLDTLGAGDSYIAGFLYNYLKYEEQEIDESTRIQQALEAACKHSSTVVLKEGSIGIGYDITPDKIASIINLPEGIL